MRELCGNGVGRDRHIGGLIAYGNERLIGVRGMPGLDRRKVRELDNAHGLMREFTSQCAISFPTQKRLAAKRRERWADTLDISLIRVLILDRGRNDEKCGHAGSPLSIARTTGTPRHRGRDGLCTRVYKTGP